jgi:hypothetical protein
MLDVITLIDGIFKIKKMKRIGITVKISGSLFSNGINQNALYLGMVLRKSGYIVDLICSDQKTYDEINKYKSDLNVTILDKSYIRKYDLIIQLGFTVDKLHFNNWKSNNKNLKLVAYQCGNHYLITTEKVLFQKDSEIKTFSDNEKFSQTPHQVWSIPQMENSNYNFYQFYNKQDNVTVVPFIWDPFVVESTFKERNKDVYTVREIQRCSVMEPNISVMKNVVMPTIILEKNQKSNPLKEIYYFGADVIKNSKPFIDFIKSTEIYKKNIVSIENRYWTSKILPDYTDFVLSWQWENNLNYLWLDVAWMGYPIVHNGSLCQDVGYYYEGFNADDAVNKIDEVIKTHNDKHKEYIQNNREIIKRYTKENQTLVDQYKMLVENVLNNKFVRMTYKWEENKVY